MITRLYLLNSLANQKPQKLPGYDNYSFHVRKFLTKEWKMENCDSKADALLNDIAKKFTAKVTHFYTEKKIGNREMSRLCEKKKTWLSEKIEKPVIPVPTPTEIKSKRKKKKLGAPKKSYLDKKSNMGRWNDAVKIRSKNCIEALIYAAVLKADNDGHTDLAHVLRELNNKPVEQGSKFRKAMEHYNKPPIVVFTPQEALALIIEMNLSRNRYRRLRKNCKNRNANLFPSYDPGVTEYMKKCKPEKIDFTKTDEVSVPMQSAIDHQILNILALPSVVKKHSDLKEQCQKSGLDYDLKLFFKYGADGTSDLGQYEYVSSGLYQHL